MTLPDHQLTEHEALIRIAGTPTIHSSAEAKAMARVANDSISKKKTRSKRFRKFGNHK